MNDLHLQEIENLVPDFLEDVLEELEKQKDLMEWFWRRLSLGEESIMGIYESEESMRNSLVEGYLKKPYARVFIPEEGGGFSAKILEFKGCYSQGETIDEAYSNLEEAALGWLAACIDQGIEIPEPLEDMEPHVWNDEAEGPPLMF